MNEVSWDVIPNELVCLIIQYMTLNQLLNLRKTSYRLLELTNECVMEFPSSKFITVPVQFISKFHRLRRTRNVFVTIKVPQQLDIIKQLPYLRQINMIIPNSVFNIQFLYALEDTNITDYKIAVTNNKGGIVNAVIVQKNKLFIHNVENDSTVQYLKHMGDKYTLWSTYAMAHIYLRSKGVNMNIISPKGIGKYIPAVYKRKVVNFLNEANLGLVNPSQPPSILNPPIKSKFNINEGVFTSSELRSLIFIYIYYNYGYNSENRGILYPDNLMQTWLNMHEPLHHSLVLQYIENLTLRTQLDMDDIVDWVWFTIPDLSKTNQIKQQIIQTDAYYRNRNQIMNDNRILLQQQLQLLHIPITYRTDGTSY